MGEKGLRKFLILSEIFTNQDLAFYCELVEDLLLISRKRLENPFALFNLQISIIQQLVIVQEGIKEPRSKRKELLRKTNGDIKKLDDNENKNIKDLEKEIMLGQVIENALKNIMDGLVWRLSGYNRSLIYTLNEELNWPSPLKADQPSFQEELYFFSNVFRERLGMAILNDSTSCIRVGDVTVFLENGDIELFEIKRGNPRGAARLRAEKQEKKIKQVREILRDGKVEKKECIRVIQLYNCPYLTYFDSLLRAINQLETDPYVCVKLDSHLVLEVFDPHRLGDYSEEKVEAQRKPHLEPWGSDYLMLDTWSLLDRPVKTNAPFSVFPLEEKICAKILTGQIFIGVYLNHKALFKKFEDRGFEVSETFFETIGDGYSSLSREERGKIPTCILKKGSLRMELPPSYLTRFLLEFLNPESVIQMAEEAYSRGPITEDEETEILSHFVQEEKLWN